MPRGFLVMQEHTLIAWENGPVDCCVILSVKAELQGRGGSKRRGTRDLPGGKAPRQSQARRGDRRGVSAHKPFQVLSLLVLSLLELMGGGEREGRHSRHASYTKATGIFPGGSVPANSFKSGMGATKILKGSILHCQNLGDEAFIGFIRLRLESQLVLAPFSRL